VAQSFRVFSRTRWFPLQEAKAAAKKEVAKKEEAAAEAAEAVERSMQVCVCI